MRFDPYNNPRLMFRDCAGSLYLSSSKSTTASTSETNNYTDNSDNRVDSRQDNRIKDAFNTTTTVTNTDNSDNRVDSRQDNRVSVRTTDNSDNRQDNRQDNRVITNNSADAELLARAYENLSKQSDLQARAASEAYANATRSSQTAADAARQTSDQIARVAQQTSADNLTATRLAIEATSGSTVEALRTTGQLATANGANLAAISSGAIAAVRQSSSDALLANRDTSRDTFAFASGANRDVLGIANDVFGKAFDGITAQTTKDLNFAGTFLGNVFESQKSADTQNLNKVVEAGKVIVVVAVLAWAFRKAV